MHRLGLLALPIVGGWLLQTSPAGAQATAPEAPPPSPPPAAPTPAPVTTDGPTVRLSADEGLVITAPDDIASLRIGTVVGARAQVADAEGVDAGGTAEIRFARLRFSGHVADPALRYFVQVDFGGSGPRLLDATLEVKAHPLFVVTAGQFLLPWGNEWQYNPAQEMFPETGPTRDYFSLGRDTGAMVHGMTTDSVFGYWAAIAIGRPISLTDDDSIRDALVVARVVVQPLGPVPPDESPYAGGEVPTAVALGVGGFFGSLVRNVERFDNSTATFGTTLPGQFEEGSFSIDAIFVSGPVSANAELDLGHRTPIDPEGRGYWALALDAQVGVFVIGHVVELAVRGSYLDPSDSPDDVFATGEVQVSLYPWGTHAALLLRYGFAHQGTNTTYIQAPPGWGHLGTAQIQMYF